MNNLTQLGVMKCPKSGQCTGHSTTRRSVWQQKGTKNILRLWPDDGTLAKGVDAKILADVCELWASSCFKHNVEMLDHECLQCFCRYTVFSNVLSLIIHIPLFCLDPTETNVLAFSHPVFPPRRLPLGVVWCAVKHFKTNVLGIPRCCMVETVN